jgi:hypothetical protein
MFSSLVTEVEFSTFEDLMHFFSILKVIIPLMVMVDWVM